MQLSFFLACLLVLLVASWPYFCFGAAYLTVDLAIDKAVLIALEIAVDFLG